MPRGSITLHQGDVSWSYDLAAESEECWWLTSKSLNLMAPTEFDPDMQITGPDGTRYRLVEESDGGE